MKRDASNVPGIGQGTIIFKDDEKIESSDLADFLFLFRGIYAAGIPLAESIYASGRKPEPTLFAEEVNKHIQRLTISEIDALFHQDLGSNRLLIERISHDSPTEIVLCGVMILIALAVILSGGTVEVRPDGIRARLPPIGKGIKCLRDALTSKTRAPVGYGVKSRTIHLNKVELAELMRQDPTTKGRGGFQGLLIGLQAKVNLHTGELVLSEQDMDRILRAGKNRKGGGFQARIHKIFSRHFDFSEED